MTTRVQNLGFARITSLLAAASWYLQWGTGTGAAASATAVTTTSTTEARVAASTAQGTTTIANDKLVLTGTITAAGSRAITELGVFDAAGSGSPPTGGTINLYGDFAAINLATSDSIAFTFNVTFA
jgi:hypothetical protein